MEAVASRRWFLRSGEVTAEQIERLRAHLECSVLNARLLAGRGLADPEAGEAFLLPRLSSLPDPLLLSGMDKAVQRLGLALSRAELIMIHGDYDVDGMSATALLVESFRAMGGRVDYHLPLRLTDGYGLSREAIEAAHQAGASVIVSVDCGISSHGPAQRAAELSLDLIITDHHQPPETLPHAHAVVNPHLPNDNFPDKGLSGVGVAFFLVLALRRFLRQQGWFQNRAEPDPRYLLDLVALGNIADIVPLTGVNRILTTHGLELMRHGRRRGLNALKQVVAVREVNCGAVGFQLAPRLNAAGRIEDGALGVDLLLCEKEKIAMDQARRLDGLNRARREIEDETLTQALERLQKVDGSRVKGIVLADARWHPGVIGIVASRLVERFHRPVVLIALDQGSGKGSARSIPGFHLFEALGRCSQWLDGFGGHEYAAGLTIQSDQVEEFTARFEDLARQLLTEELLTPRISHDGEALLEQIDFNAVSELARMAPFGPGNPEPVLLVREVRVGNLRPVGRGHLKMQLVQGNDRAEAIAFGMASRAAQLEGTLDMLCSPQINSWNGRNSVQLRIRDFRPSGEGDVLFSLCSAFQRPIAARQADCAQ